MTDSELPTIERYVPLLSSLEAWYPALGPAIAAHREEWPDGDLDHLFFGLEFRQELIRAANDGDRDAVSRLLQFIEALARFPPRDDILGLLDATILPMLAFPDDLGITPAGVLLVRESLGRSTAQHVDARVAEYDAWRAARGPVSLFAHRIAEGVRRWSTRARR